MAGGAGSRQFKPLGDPGPLDAGVACLSDWGWWWNVRLIRPALGTCRRRPPAVRGDTEGPGRLLACVVRVVGVSPAAGAALPEQAGWLPGYSDALPFALARLALGLGGRHPRADVTGLASEPEWKQQRCRACLFGEPLLCRCRRTLEGGVAVEAPCWWPTLTVATHSCSAPPVLPPSGGGCADPGRT